MTRALIKVGYSCNEHCTFCHALDTRGVDGAGDEVHRLIARARELGHTMVALSGGEPTIRPELLAWAAHVAGLGMDLGLITNGQMLAYPELVERLLRLRLRYAHVALHGGTADVHERLTRADGFERTVRALGHLAAAGIELTIGAVVTRQNADALFPLVDLALGIPGARLKLIMLAPKGGGQRHLEALMPRVSFAAERVREAIEYGLRRSTSGAARFAHEGFPLCLLPGLGALTENLRGAGFTAMVEVGEPDFCPIDDVLQTWPAASCDGCAQRAGCPGLYRGYVEAFGADELPAPAAAS